jgi:hypothetical protein
MTGHANVTFMFRSCDAGVAFAGTPARLFAGRARGPDRAGLAGHACASRGDGSLQKLSVSRSHSVTPLPAFQAAQAIVPQ